jgi:hypothetical protein
MRTSFIPPLVLSVLFVAGRAAAAEPTCQEMRDQYAIVAGKGFGFAPPEVQSAWKQKSCSTKPQDSRKNELCQEMSDRFGIVAGSTFGSANADVQKSWKELSCKTTPASK